MGDESTRQEAFRENGDSSEMHKARANSKTPSQMKQHPQCSQ